MPTYQNMVALQTVTVGAGGAANITFSAIPQTYTDLRIIFSGRTTATNQTVSIQFNSDTTATNYRRTTMGSTGSASFFQNLNDRGIGYVPISTYTANTFGAGEIYIPNYTSSNAKSYFTQSTTENNGGESYLGLIANSWTGTAAISTIVLTNNGNWVQYSSATLYGISNPVAAGAKATGGFVAYDNTYVYHTFLASGTFTPTQSISADILVVAGGGGGGFTTNSRGGGGGGGAGGLVAFTSQALSATNYTVTVGAGGAGATSLTAVNGSNSVFGALTAAVGGGGGACTFSGSGANTGGSGGGAEGDSFTTGANGTAGQGNKGGNGASGSATGTTAGGGGGAGAVGTNATTTTTGAGGIGSSAYATWAIATGTGQNSGTTYYYAGGGGGGGSGQDLGVFAGAVGGAGGGGLGGTTTNGGAGLVNTGGGGGGAGARFNTGARDGGAGGSGIVIVRYAK